MIKVGVLRGGVSSEYDLSLLSGEHILSCLRSDKMNDKYKPIDILITKDGAWHINGLPLMSLEQIHNKIDIVLNALHGEFGEDGKVQQLLDQWKIPYTGSGSFASALGYNKQLAKDQFARLGIKTPKHILYPANPPDFDGPRDQYAEEKAHEILRRLPPPWIVKPLTGGSSTGIHVCKTFAELARAFEMGVNQNVSVLVEEMIEGKVATVGVVEDFRKKDLYTFPVIGRFSEDEKSEMEYLAGLVHSGLNLSHYSESDFIVHPKKGVYIIEVNTLPKLHAGSLLYSHLENVGSSMPEFLSHIIELARQK